MSASRAARMLPLAVCYVISNLVLLVLGWVPILPRAPTSLPHIESSLPTLYHDFAITHRHSSLEVAYYCCQARKTTYLHNSQVSTKPFSFLHIYYSYSFQDYSLPPPSPLPPQSHARGLRSLSLLNTHHSHSFSFLRSPVSSISYTPASRRQRLYYDTDNHAFRVSTTPPPRAVLGSTQARRSFSLSLSVSSPACSLPAICLLCLARSIWTGPTYPGSACPLISITHSPPPFDYTLPFLPS